MSWTLFDTADAEQEDIVVVLKALAGTCDNCRLGLAHPHNRGFLSRGNPLAKIAFVHEAPRDSETERGVAMLGAHGRAFEHWMQFLGLDTRADLFVTTVVQCQPPKVEKNDVIAQREPDDDEVASCFGPRCLRVLRAMPNLEVVVTLGWPAAKALLGGKPGMHTHEAQWFESSLLPGKPIFCMVDPVWTVRDPSPEKNMVAERSLLLFQREYLKERWVVQLAADARTRRDT